jgi:hypothetical protein
MNMDNKQLIIDYWIEKSKQDIDSARDNYEIEPLIDSATEFVEKMVNMIAI